MKKNVKKNAYGREMVKGKEYGIADDMGNSITTAGSATIGPFAPPPPTRGALGTAVDYWGERNPFGPSDQPDAMPAMRPGAEGGALAPEIPAYVKAQVKRYVSKMKALMSQRTKLDKQIQNLENKDAEKRIPTRIFGSDI